MVARQKHAEEQTLDRERKLHLVQLISDRIKGLQQDMVYLRGMQTAGKLSTACFETAAGEVNKSIHESKEELARSQTVLKEAGDPEQSDTDIVLFVLRCTAAGLHAKQRKFCG